QLDVAVADGKVATVEAGIDAGRAGKVVDATGKIVTPGLIDLHTHVYWGSTFWGIYPDPVAARTGVTTWLDVGSSGGYNFPGLRKFIVEESKSRVYALLNISSIGLTGPSWELANPDYLDVALGQTIIEANRDVIVGVKARIDTNTTRNVGIKALDIARELAEAVDLPLMIHIGAGPPTIDEVIERLRPGDIITHCFTGQSMNLLDPNGQLYPRVAELRAQGLVLDIGHGAGSFSFDTARTMLANGVMPDVISTDIHQLAIQGPCFDMPTTISKFLAIGMSLEDAIERSTIKPAQAIHLDHLGSLKPGSPADIAMFHLEDGDYTFQDIFMNEQRGSQLLVNDATWIDGEALERVPYPDLQPWAVLNENQRSKMIPLVEVPFKPAAPLLDNRK
ncbi:MAG: amidohydrolase/deacetylase family metallohydrolase, partial [Thermomicrobiales bacterium]|nr:amidohydrolase/deacetylase family metallohydrolase [Thermomicrobiales bacterium]